MNKAIPFSALILVSNLICIALLATDVPFWDQWDAEADLYVKWLDNALSLEDLVAPHVQHRFALSRLLRLLVFEIAGGWSPIANMVVQSFMVPVIFLVFFACLKDRLVSRQRALLFYFVSTLVFVIPLYWELILLGFQSHFYLSSIFSFLLLRLSSMEPGKSSILWFTLVGLLNTFTSAASPIPLLACLIIQVIALYGINQKSRVSALVLLGITAVLFALNLALRVVPEDLQQCGADGAIDLVWLSLQAFSWPTEYLGIICLWIIPAIFVVRSHRAWTREGFKQMVSCLYRTRSNLLLSGILLWLVLSIVSIAYSRGNLALFASRYMLIYGFTLYVPLLVYLIFADGRAVEVTKNVGRPGAILLAAAYCFLFLGFLIGVAKQLNNAIDYKSDMDMVRRNYINSVKEHDVGILYEQQAVKSTYCGHPNPRKVYNLMHHPELRAKLLWLPEEFRK